MAGGADVLDKLPEQLAELVVHPALVGFFEGLTLVALSYFVLPVFLRRARDIADAIAAIEACARLAEDIIGSRLNDTVDDAQLGKLRLARGKVGKTLRSAFKGHPRYDDLQPVVARFTQSTKECAEDGVARNLLPAALLGILQHKEYAVETLRRYANRYVAWTILRHNVKTD